MNEVIQTLQSASAEIAQLSGMEASVNLFTDAKPGETPTYNFYGRVGDCLDYQISVSASSFEELMATLRRKCADTEELNRRRVEKLQEEAVALGYMLMPSVDHTLGRVAKVPAVATEDEFRKPGEPAMF